MENSKKMVCDRCGRPLSSIRIMNIGSPEVICMECHHRERGFTPKMKAETIRFLEERRRLSGLINLQPATAKIG